MVNLLVITAKDSCFVFYNMIELLPYVSDEKLLCFVKRGMKIKMSPVSVHSYINSC